MIDINLYHWVWYLIGFILTPKLTVMIFISIYFKEILPFPLFMIGWGFAILSMFPKVKVNKNDSKRINKQTYRV